MKLYESYFDWVVIPNDLPKSNLVMVVAKTVNPTYHKNDPKYSIRLFDEGELKEAARSLARRRIGKNHGYLIDNAFVVDAQWNNSTKAIEALMFLPDKEINKIKEGKINKVSVEYVWRTEEGTPEGVKFEGLVFDRVDLLEGMEAGDNGTMLRLCESIEDNKGIMEGDILTEKEETDKLKEDADSFCKRLGEPFAGYTNFADCVAKNKDKDNPEAYCGYIKHKVEDEPKKKEGELEEGDSPNTMPFPTDKPTVEEVSKVGDTTRPEATNPMGQLPDIKQEPTGTVIYKIGDDDKLKESKEEKKEEVKEVKKEEVKEQPKQEEVKAETPKEESKQVEQPKTVEPDAKDVRIQELEGAVTKLQENIKVKDTEKQKAVEEARKETKKDIINRMEDKLPDVNIVSKFNLGGQILAKDIRKVLYEMKEEVKDSVEKKKKGE